MIVIVYKLVLVCPNGYFQQQPLVVINHILSLLTNIILFKEDERGGGGQGCKRTEITTQQDKGKLMRKIKQGQNTDVIKSNEPYLKK